ncbi:DUF5320 domain-containing protein [Desulfocastanea catecholica]
MPGFNQRGPEGLGPMTGRQQGMCRRTDDQSLAFGRGYGQGLGGGRGMGMRRGLGLGQGLRMGRRFDDRMNLPVTPPANLSDELKNLREEYQAAQNTLSSLEGKIAALEAQK